MDRVLYRTARLDACVLGWAVALCVQASLVVVCVADDEPLPTPPQQVEQQPMSQSASDDMRSGGLVAHSYEYHRQHLTKADLQPMRSQIELGGIPQANGWYNYGFPMKSFRYGWFGAERPFYPHVM